MLYRNLGSAYKADSRKDLTQEAEDRTTVLQFFLNL